MSLSGTISSSGKTSVASEELRGAEDVDLVADMDAGGLDDGREGEEGEEGEKEDEKQRATRIGSRVTGWMCLTRRTAQDMSSGGRAEEEQR